MLIYEKDNKLNINFENSVNESPDLQIGKSGDKTEVLIDGQPGGGGSGGASPVIVTVTQTSEEEGTWSGATWAELCEAYLRGCAFIEYAEEYRHIRRGEVTNNAITLLISEEVSVYPDSVVSSRVDMYSDGCATFTTSVYPEVP